MDYGSRKYHRERVHRQEFGVGYYLQKARVGVGDHEFKSLRIVSTFSNHLLSTILSIDLDAWELKYLVSQDSFEDVEVQLERLKLSELNHECVVLIIQDIDLFGIHETDIQSMKMKIDSVNSLISQMTEVKFFIPPIFAVNSATSQENLNHINSYYMDQIRSHLHVTMMNELIESYGITNDRMIVDRKSVNFSVSPMAPGFLKAISLAITNQLCVSHFASAKVILLDADNILWDGIIAESAIEEIRHQFIHFENPYFQLQSWLVELMTKGFILCLVSKNNQDDLEKVFQEVPEMPLKLEMFTRIAVNWNEKVDNVESISKALSLGPEDFVFLDDSPIEREKMRLKLPAIFTPEIQNGVELETFIKGISPLIPRKQTREDSLRHSSYLNRDKIQSVRSNSANLEVFLKSLQMTSHVTSNVDMDVPRALQIIQKTNQFNMTGLRIDESTLEAMLKNERFYFFQGSLRDKYGDNGNVILSCFERVSEYRMNILLFNMSCRVIGRNLEYEFLDWSMKSLRSILGVSEFVVHVTPTQKNRNFIDFFEKSGFTSISQDVFMKRGPNQSGISPNFIEIEGTGKWKN